MHPLIVIPARFGSTRIPGKPLSKINEEPLIVLVTRRVLGFGLNAEIVVATDDARIEQAVSGAGVRTVRTKSHHKCGTERVAEVVEVEVKYEGYIARDFESVERMKGMEDVALPKDLDYSSVDGLTIEAIQKLTEAKPMTLGQALRIPGISPAASAVILVHLKKSGSI